MNAPPQPGQTFNPYRMFVGLYIPEGLACSKSISAGAKLAWGRLARYAGENGLCFPTMKTLGAEIGVGERQAQKYLVELEKAKLIRRVTRFNSGAQTSNAFEFLWHELFERGANDSSGEGVNDRSPKESHLEESHLEEINYDQDCIPQCAEKPNPRKVASEPSVCTQYPTVRECLARYMQLAGDHKDYPTDRMVVDIMDAAGTYDEAELITALHYLYSERGLKPGTKHGPQMFAWFKTVIGDYFTKKRERESAANPCGYHEWKDRNALTEQQFDSMMNAL